MAQLLHHDKFVIHGHRGCRGLYPENMLTGFLEAIRLGVDAIELDVVVSYDKTIIVSHEPWMNHQICLRPDGGDIDAEQERPFNIYYLTHQEITLFNCGEKPHPYFPQQKKVAEHKPTLKEVIIQCEAYIQKHNLSPIVYNIEIKSEKHLYDVFQPQPDKFVSLLLNELNAFELQNRVLLQSFDMNILRELKKLKVSTPLGLLIETEKGTPESQIQELGFQPEYYNPDFYLLNEKSMRWLKDQDIHVLAWTVNKYSDMQLLQDLGVNGVITDYPNIMINEA